MDVDCADEQQGIDAVAPGEADVVELQAHESPLPLPASAMWQHTAQAALASGQRTRLAGATPHARAGRAQPAADAHIGQQPGAEDSPAANFALPHLNAVGVATPRMFGTLTRTQHICDNPI